MHLSAGEEPEQSPDVGPTSGGRAQNYKYNKFEPF